MKVSQNWLRSKRLSNTILAGFIPLLLAHYVVEVGIALGSVGCLWRGMVDGRLGETSEKGFWFVWVALISFFGKLLGEIARLLCDFEGLRMRKEVGESDFANLRSPFCKKPFLKFGRWVFMPKLIKIAKCESSRLRLAVDPDHLQLLDESDPLWVKSWKTLWNS